MHAALACHCTVQARSDAMAFSVEGGTVGVVAERHARQVYPGIYLLDNAERSQWRPSSRPGLACVEVVEQDWSGPAHAYRQWFSGTVSVLECAGFSTYTDEATWFPTGEGLVRAGNACPEYQQAGAGDPALVLPIYTRLSDAGSRTQAFGLEGPAAVALTGVDALWLIFTLRLRPMTMNDLDQVAELEAAAHADAHSAWSKQTFYDELSGVGRGWWLAHDRGTGQPGFAGGRLAGAQFDGRSGFVAPERRRQELHQAGRTRGDTMPRCWARLQYR